MRLLKHVPTIEVKRCFVTAELVKEYGGKKGKLGKITHIEFKRALARAKRHVLQMSEAELDSHISPRYKRRLIAYNTSDWHLATIYVTEVGVWRRAGGLPLAWTNGSLEETAAHIHKVMKRVTLARTRARRVIFAMTETNVTDLQAEKYLLPIVFEGGTGTRGRWSLHRKMKGDIDDGCMRSIALTVHGAKTLKVYFGTPKKLPAT